MRDALVASRNVPAVQAFQQVAQQAGLDKIADFVHGLGVDYGNTLHEAAAIGGFDGTDPLTMSAAYSAFGRGGYYIEPYAFTKVVYLETEDVYTYKVEKSRAMSAETAYMITDMLVTAGASGVGGSFSVSGTQIAAKGGTTTIDRASASALGIPSTATPNHWNITYSPDACIALWYGYDSNAQGYLTSTTGNRARKAIMKAVATKIYKKNSKFNKPSGVESVLIEKETYPTQLALKDLTPSDLKVTELYKSGYEPSEYSNRFAVLNNPTNGKSNFDGTTITLSWDPIATPQAIDIEYLEDKFNNDEYWKFYEKYKADYYQKRLDYNTEKIGTIGYQVYLKDSTEQLISLGYTTNTTYTYTPTTLPGDYTFVIKSAYSIFKDNISSGLTINAQAIIDTNIEDTGGPSVDNPPENENPGDNNSENNDNNSSNESQTDTQ